VILDHLQTLQSRLFWCIGWYIAGNSRTFWNVKSFRTTQAHIGKFSCRQHCTIRYIRTGSWRIWRWYSFTKMTRFFRWTGRRLVNFEKPIWCLLSMASVSSLIFLLSISAIRIVDISNGLFADIENCYCFDSALMISTIGIVVRIVDIDNLVLLRSCITDVVNCNFRYQYCTYIVDINYSNCRYHKCRFIN